MRLDDDTTGPAPRPFFTLRARPSWPPYRLVEEGIEKDATRRLERLERLYHVGQDQAWDGREVLAALIAKHGAPRLPPEREAAALQILSILLWGELAAWAISADLAESIDDVEAKMAATSQAHDEARHFYVLRDYLRALGKPVPRLGGIGRRLLIGILEAPTLVHKLVGMQLLVESNALALFRGIAEANLEPVLAELLPYYEKDEARHVGLGVLYLPRLLRRLSVVEAARVSAFQLRCVAMLISAGLPLREQFRALGMEPRDLASHTIKLQDGIFREMLQVNAESGGAATTRTKKGLGVLGGVLNPASGFGPRVFDFIHPPDGDQSVAPWRRALLDVAIRAARLADRALA